MQVRSPESNEYRPDIGNRNAKLSLLDEVYVTRTNRSVQDHREKS